MVLVHLKSQFVSLFVTVLSGVAELLLFGALLGFNKYAECQALRRGKPVSVRLHRARTKFLAIFAMVVFIVLEVIMSFFSDPDFSSIPDPRPCVSIRRYDLFDTQVVGFSSDSVLVNCIRTSGTKAFQHVGNRSKVDDTVTCAESPLYEFSDESIVMQPLDLKYSKACTLTTSFETGRNVLSCVYGVAQGRDFSLSEFLSEERVEDSFVNKTKVSFLHTTTSFNISKGQEQVLTDRALEAFANNTNDPMELRRRVFTSSAETTCEFSIQEDATQVPLVLIYIIVITWVFSFLAFVSTLLLKRHIFYDMGDPLHWAQRTHRNIDEPITGNPVVTSVYEHGERLMYVSSSSSDEYDFLRRVKTGLRDRFTGRSNRNNDTSNNQFDTSVDEQI